MAFSAVDEIVTVREAVTAPADAVMVAPVAPTANRPLEVTVAAFGSDELHCTSVVTSRVLLSLKVAKACSCCLVLAGSDSDAGEIERPVIVTELTYNVVDAETPLRVAVIVADDPPDTAVASPVLETIVTTPVAEELQLAVPVTSVVLPSLYVPSALYCTVIPAFVVWSAGAIVIATKVGVTVRVVAPDVLPDVAVIVVIPAETADASPELLIVAIFVADDDQATDVSVFWLPSL